MVEQSTDPSFSAKREPFFYQTKNTSLEEGQNLLYSMQYDGPLPTERDLTLEALKMVDEAMRPDPKLGRFASLPGSFSRRHLGKNSLFT